MRGRDPQGRQQLYTIKVSPVLTACALRSRTARMSWRKSVWSTGAAMDLRGMASTQFAEPRLTGAQVDQQLHDRSLAGSVKANETFAESDRRPVPQVAEDFPGGPLA